MDTLGGKTAVRLRAFPEVIEGSPLNGVHEGIIGKLGGTSGLGILAGSEEKQKRRGR